MNAFRDPAVIASRLVVGLAGTEATPAERAWLRRWRPAGVILFGRNVVGPGQLAALTRTLREDLDPEAEIVADHEGGPVSVLAAATGRPPAARVLGDVDDPDLTRRVHADSAARAVALGVDRLLAPSCDVLSEPRNTVIGVRAFASRADRAARHVAAAVRGLRDGGVAVCPKHWPGHGGTHEDTHERDVAMAVAGEAAPFDAARDAGAADLMVAHLPAADGGPPLTLDPAGLSALAASRPGTTIWCDDVTMAALRPLMTERTGETADDGGGPGTMTEPGDLPLSWLREPLVCGCDRVLVRGIPWRALPGPATDASGDPPGAVNEEPVPESPASWREAHERLATTPPAPPLDAVWFDTTSEHRWPGPTVEDLAEAGCRGQLRRWSPDAHHPPAALLVVTSHRPLAPDEIAGMASHLEGDERWILVLGHPSLLTDLLGADGDASRIRAGGDMSLDALKAWFGG